MTKTEKHTLEPWQVRTDLDGKPKLDSRDGYTVERTDPTAGKPFVVSTWSLFHAHLIAAAPVMLETLIMVRDADDDCKRDGLPSMTPFARAKIDAAIAKAEGLS